MSVLLSMLSAETGLFEGDLLKIIRTAPRRYKTFLIPKRSGGMREIAQPAREVKLLQHFRGKATLKATRSWPPNRVDIGTRLNLKTDNEQDTVMYV